MKIFKKIISFVVFALIFFFGLTAHALNTDLGATVNLNADGSMSAGQTNPSASGSVDSSVTVTSGMNTATSSNTGGTATTDTGSMSGNGNAGFSLSRNNLANLHIDLNVASSSTPDMVASDADLSTYAAASMNTDEHLQKVSSDEKEVMMKYRESAKFLGFIPGKISTNVVVDANGDVHVRYPWYRFLMKVGQSRSDMEAQIKANLQAQGAGSEGSATFNAEAKARIMAAVRQAVARARDAMNAKANASAQGSASAEY